MPEIREATIYDGELNGEGIPVITSIEPYIVSDAELLEEVRNQINSMRIQLNNLETRFGFTFETFSSGLPDRTLRIEEFLKQLFPSISP